MRRAARDDRRTPAPGRVLAAYSRAGGYPDRLAHGFLALTLALVAAGSVLVLLAWGMTHARPSWWTPPAPESPETRQRARDVERRVTMAMNRHRPAPEPWTIAVSSHQASAWVNVRLPRWLENEGIGVPDGAGPIQVLFRDRAVTVAAEVGAHPDSTRVVGATIEPELGADGSVRARVRSLSIGGLVLPGAFGANRVGSSVPESLLERPGVRVFLESVLAGEPLLEDAVFRVDRSREVRVTGLRIDDGVLLLTCVTDLRRDRRAELR